MMTLYKILTGWLETLAIACHKRAIAAAKRKKARNEIALRRLDKAINKLQNDNDILTEWIAVATAKLGD